MVQSNRVVPCWNPEGYQPAAAKPGVRPATQQLLNEVNQDDPAFMFIAAELLRVRRTGGDLNRETIKEAIHAGRSRHDEHRQQEMAKARIPKSIVYYIRRGQAVKIGTTASPEARFRDLLPDEILAWEPGGRSEESQRHEQFRSLRISRSAEYFRRDGALDEHIKRMRERHGAPSPAWPTLGSLLQHKTRVRLPEAPLSPELVTLAAGTQALGIRYNTACVWVHRGKLRPLLADADGKQLFLLSDLRSLANGGRRSTGVT